MKILHTCLAATLLSISSLHGSCDNAAEVSWEEEVFLEDDEYLTGYVQALLDLNYDEFQVRICVRDRVVYVFNLPNIELAKTKIICYLRTLSCVDSVEVVCLDDCETLCINQEAVSPCYTRLCGIWFPQNTLLFYPLIADPRQVMNAAALRYDDDVVGKHVGAVSFGDDFIFLRLKDMWRWRGDMDFGIQAGIFTVFDLDHPEACLVNTDFFVAPEITYAAGHWAFRLRIWHLSSHLGDEFLLSNPNFDRRNVSDEGVDLFASYNFGNFLRLYGGVGDIFDRDKSFREKPFYFEFGTEIRTFGHLDQRNALIVQPFLAMHFRCWQQNNYNIDQTYALGAEWGKPPGVGRKFRLFFEYHNGFSREGQFVKLKSDYASIKLDYGF